MVLTNISGFLGILAFLKIIKKKFKKRKNA